MFSHTEVIVEGFCVRKMLHVLAFFALCEGFGSEFVRNAGGKGESTPQLNLTAKHVDGIRRR